MSLILIGRLGRTHGLDGSLFFYPIHHPQNVLKKEMSVALYQSPRGAKDAQNQDSVQASLSTVKNRPKDVMLKFHEYPTVEAAQKLVNHYLFVKREEFPALPSEKNDVYLCDLELVEVFSLEEQKSLGVIQSFEFNGADQTIVHLKGEKNSCFILRPGVLQSLNLESKTAQISLESLLYL